MIKRLNDFGVSYLKEVLGQHKIVGQLHLWVVYVNDELNQNSPHNVVDLAFETVYLDEFHIDVNLY